MHISMLQRSLSFADSTSSMQSMKEDAKIQKKEGEE